MSSTAWPTSPTLALYHTESPHSLMFSRLVCYYTFMMQGYTVYYHLYYEELLMYCTSIVCNIFDDTRNDPHARMPLEGTASHWWCAVCPLPLRTLMPPSTPSSMVVWLATSSTVPLSTWPSRTAPAHPWPPHTLPPHPALHSGYVCVCKCVFPSHELYGLHNFSIFVMHLNTSVN